MSDKIFANGLFFTEPLQSAPAFVMGKLKIKADDAIEFIQANVNDGGWITLDIKKSKGGKCYLEVNNFKKQGEEEVPY